MDNQAPQQSPQDKVSLYDISQEQPVVGSVPPEDVEPAIISGDYSFPKGQKVPVINPDGVFGHIEPEDAVDAFQGGYKFATPKLQDNAKYGGYGQMGVTALEGAAGTIAPGIAPALETGLGLAKKEDIVGRARTNPGSHLLGEAGALLSGYGLLGGAGAIGELATGGTAAAVSGLIGETGMARVLARAAGGAAEFGALGTGDEFNKIVEQDPEQTSQTSTSHVLQSAMLGGAFGAAGGGLEALWKDTAAGKYVQDALGSIKNKVEPIEGMGNEMPPLMKAALAKVTGVSKDDISKFMLNQEAIEAAPKMDEIRESFLNKIEDVTNEHNFATDEFKDAKSNFEDAIKEVKSQHREATFDAIGEARESKKALKDATLILQNNLSQNAFNQAAPLSASIDALRELALNEAKSAYSILEQNPSEISVQPLLDHAQELIKPYTTTGVPEDFRVAKKIQGVIDGFVNENVTGAKMVPLTTAKNMIMSLDNLSKWSLDETNNSAAKSFRQLRNTLDELLKKASPEYAKAVAPAAEKYELLGKLSKFGFGDTDANISKIKTLSDRANYTIKAPYLRQLEEFTGNKFMPAIDKYASPALQRAMQESLPEYAQNKKLIEILQDLKNPRTIKAKIAALQNSPEATELSLAEQRLREATESHESLNGLTARNLQGHLEGALGKSDYSKEIIAKSPELEGLKGLTASEALELIRLDKLFSAEHAKKTFFKKLLLKSVTTAVGGTAGTLIGGIPGTIIGSGLGVGLGEAAEGQSGNFAKSLMKKYNYADGGVVDTGSVQPSQEDYAQGILDHFMDKYGDLPDKVGASQDATKMALHALLSGQNDVDVNKFKAAAQYIDSAKNGTLALQRGAKSVFKNAQVLPQNLVPSAKDNLKLEKHLDALNQNPQKVMEIGNGISDYLPEHASALAEIGMNSAQLAQMQKPQSVKQSPLDGDAPVSPDKKAAWNRTLTMAQQPLMALHHLKEGTLLPSDVNTVKSIYPNWHEQASKELTNHMIEKVNKGEHIPYKLRQGLSMFLGQSLDSTMKQPNIMAAQATFMAKAQQQQAAPQGKQSGGTAKLDKVSGQYRTADQAAQSRLSSNKV